jgi:hypothetical protein
MAIVAIRVIVVFFESQASITLMAALGLIGSLAYATGNPVPPTVYIICACIAALAAVTIFFQVRAALRKEKQEVMSRLHNEYLVTRTTSIPPRVFARMDPLPSEWVNQRLKELGHSWRVEDNGTATQP